jgi:hypothetical protein
MVLGLSFVQNSAKAVGIVTFRNSAHGIGILSCLEQWK